jgi:hypothetical protein
MKTHDALREGDAPAVFAALKELDDLGLDKVDPNRPGESAREWARRQLFRSSDAVALLKRQSGLDDTRINKLVDDIFTKTPKTAPPPVGRDIPHRWVAFRMLMDVFSQMHLDFGSQRPHLKEDAGPYFGFPSLAFWNSSAEGSFGPEDAGRALLPEIVAECPLRGPGASKHGMKKVPTGPNVKVSNLSFYARWPLPHLPFIDTSQVVHTHYELNGSRLGGDGVVNPQQRRTLYALLICYLETLAFNTRSDVPPFGNVRSDVIYEHTPK